MTRVKGVAGISQASVFTLGLATTPWLPKVVAKRGLRCSG